MYQYNYADQTLVEERVAQFRDQTERFLAGELPEEQFLPLRLQNGLYIQRYAPMLRIAIPYGLLASYQLRKLAEITRKYDKGYGHMTTRTNIQLNWPKLEEVPDILAELATVQMHAIQTSGNCIRNTTTDPYAGIHKEEIADPRPYCEIIRQWSTFHPEFAFLPRKFKIAVIGTEADRAATQVHDVGLHIITNDAGELGFEVIVGGGLGRTPVIGKTIRKFLPREHLLSYLDAILRVYNLHGRRDNKYKARIKILVDSLGGSQFAKLVDAEWEAHTKDGPLTLTEDNFDTAASYFSMPDYQSFDALAVQSELQAQLADNKDFADWYTQNTVAHKVDGYHAVVISLKAGLVDGRYVPSGDLSDSQMDALADLSDRYSFGELRGTYQQNLVFADVQTNHLYELWQQLSDLHLARANINTLTDMIVCPGWDYCSLANATTHNIAEQIEKQFDDLDYLYDLGDIRLNMSGCMNACAHHHTGDIGILGVDKKGEHWYQISLGGNSSNDAKLGKILGKAVPADDVASTLQTILDVYLDIRGSNEQDVEGFADVVDRVGIAPLRRRSMANHHVLDSHGKNISGEDTWQALATAQLPDGIALSNLTLLELLHKQEKVDVLVPLADLLNADGQLANGLLEQVFDILKQHSSRLGVWITSNTDADALADVKDFLVAQDLIVIHVPSFVDGRGFSFAQTLRQLGYEGEIRMAGNFGRDQIAYLLRAGATSFVLNEHDLQSISDISQAFTALASSYDGRNAAALPMFAKQSEPSVAQL